MVKKILIFNNEGFLEIELGDWKDNRVFRLMAVDQGELIFHDTIFDKSKTFVLV